MDCLGSVWSALECVSTYHQGLRWIPSRGVPWPRVSCIHPALDRSQNQQRHKSGHWGFPGSLAPDGGNWSYILTTPKSPSRAGAYKSQIIDLVLSGIESINKEFDNWETEFAFIVKLLMLNMSFIFNCDISAQIIQCRINFHDVIICMEAIVPLLMHILYT